MTLKENWRQFSEAPVGERFQARYHSSSNTNQPWFRKPAILIVGTLVLLAGLFMLMAPGPGFLAFFLGAALLAEQSLWVARLLDRGDQQGRWLAQALQRRWQASGTGLKLLIVLIALVTLIGLAGLGVWMALQFIR